MRAESPSHDPTWRPIGPQRLAQVDRNGLEVLSRGECLQLLGGATLGRIGITIQALPLILPVNFKLVGHAIVFRTGPGTKLDAATRGSVVAFEADEIEPFSHAGWSVVVTGVAQEVTSPGRIAELALERVPRWAPAAGDQLVEVSTEVMSGRRIVPGLFNLVGRTTREPSPGRLQA